MTHGLTKDGSRTSEAELEHFVDVFDLYGGLLCCGKARAEFNHDQFPYFQLFHVMGLFLSRHMAGILGAGGPHVPGPAAGVPPGGVIANAQQIGGPDGQPQDQGHADLQGGRNGRQRACRNGRQRACKNCAWCSGQTGNRPVTRSMTAAYRKSNE